MAKRILDVDPVSGVVVYHDYDPLTDKTIIGEYQDAAPWIEFNKAIQNLGDTPGGRLNAYSQRGIKEEWWHVARIPDGVALQWLKDYGVNIHNRDHWPRVRRLLNDPDWRYLRTGTGNV